VLPSARDCGQHGNTATAAVPQSGNGTPGAPLAAAALLTVSYRLATPARIAAKLLGLAAGRAVPEPAATPDRAVTRVIRDLHERQGWLPPGHATDMIKLYYQCSSGTTPGLGADKLAPGLSSATTAMTQKTARTVTSEAQPGLVHRDPATAPAAWACRSGHLITCCLQSGGRVVDADCS
jgi:hypothetical protein